jgi:midasin (ATPase involved in ribosome maturation)
MARPKRFHWQLSLLKSYIATTAYTPRDGGETSRVKYEDGALRQRMGSGDWRIIAKVNLPSADGVADFTQLECDLLSSVLLQLGYKPGNVNDL